MVLGVVRLLVIEVPMYPEADPCSLSLSLGLCLGPDGSPRGGAVSYERGTPVKRLADSAPTCRQGPFCKATLQGYLALKKAPPLGPYSRTYLPTRPRKNLETGLELTTSAEEGAAAAGASNLGAFRICQNQLEYPTLFCTALPN